MARPLQVRPAGQGRPPPQRVTVPAGGKNVTVIGGKGPNAGLGSSRPSAKEKGEFGRNFKAKFKKKKSFTEKKSFSTAYTGDDDINDVAAMGGVNLAEETQKILGSTEYVGTQIRSCKEEIMCSMGPLQLKVLTYVTHLTI